jgi:hypothetical protein
MRSRDREVPLSPKLLETLRHAREMYRTHSRKADERQSQTDCKVVPSTQDRIPGR